MKREQQPRILGAFACCLLALAGGCSEDDGTSAEPTSGADTRAPGPDVTVAPESDTNAPDGGGPACENLCAPVGATRCGSGGVEVCGLHNDDSCTEWGAATPCPDRQTCTAGKCGITCTDGCSVAGATRCSAGGVQTCGDLDGDTCLEWSSAVPCEAPSTCAAGVCTTACTNECTTPGTHRCAGTQLETCGQYDADACLDWGGGVACPSGETCSAGVCSGKCVDECTAAGVSLCSGNGTITCGQLDADPCLEWSTPTPCKDGQTCSGGACGLGCTDECDTVGARRCSLLGVETCGQVDADACLEWGAPAACNAGEGCSFGQCSKLCVDECSTVGARRCTANGVEQCGNFDGDACLDWGTPMACPPGESCSFGSCDAKCKDECPAMGATECDGPLVRTCGNVDGDSCLEWSNGVVCETGLCAAGACAEKCVDECPAEGVAVCQQGAARRCGHYDGDPCLEWGTAAFCSAPTTCAFGECIPGCVDECEAGQTSCESGAVRVCSQADEDPCLEWGTATPCPGGSCSAGACAASCTDDCSAGERRCAGPHAAQGCGDYDADPCLDWGPAALCDLGATCSAGTCSTPAVGPSCDDVLTCRQGCAGEGGCELGCAIGVGGDAATALGELDACAAGHACTEPLCPVLFCPSEGAACRFPEPGADACIDLLDCLYDCTDAPEVCLAACASAGTPAAQAQLYQLVGCTGAYCGNDATCVDNATNTGGPCSVEFATCLGPDDPGSSCRTLLTCVGQCEDSGGDTDSCESTCLPGGHLVGQSEYYALMGCAETFDCQDSACLAQFCAFEFASCLSPGAGDGSCAALAGCAAACTTAACDEACWGAADLQQQVIFAARQLCVRGVCPSADSACAAAALQGPCAGLEASCQGL